MMTAHVTRPRTTFAESWERWHREREQAAAAPYGIASLAATHWLHDQPEAVAEIPGMWSVAAGGVTVTDHQGRLADAHAARLPDEYRLEPDEEVRFGDVRLRAFHRDGATAVRVYDPANPARLGVGGIDAFQPDVQWIVHGALRPLTDASVVVTSVDGHVNEQRAVGEIAFRAAGQDLRLTVLARGTEMHTIFRDHTSGLDTYRFRYVSVQRGEDDDTLLIDFNRAYLPPCAFSDAYVCPMPPPGNDLPIEIRAGEKRVVRPAPAEA